MSSYTKLRNEHKEHGWALRAIGQDLAAILPKSLEIDFTGQLYVVRGMGKAGESPAAKKNRSVGKLLNKLRSKREPAHEPHREPVPFERSYTLEQIYRLAEGGKSRRRNSPLAPDINVLGERLRAVGKMIEAKGGQLIKLTMDSYRVAFKYRDAQGKIQEEEHTTPSLYRSQKSGQPRRLAGKERDAWAKVRK